MRSLSAWWACIAVSAVARAQQPEIDVQPIPGCREVAVVFTIEHPFPPPAGVDAPGVPRLLAECRLLRARAAAPSVRAVRIHADRCASTVVGVFASQDAAGLRAFVAGVVAAAPLDDDAIAVLVARSALAADDDAAIYPGSLLRARFERHFAPAGSDVADPAAIAALTPVRVRELLSAPGHLALGLFGAVADDARRAFAELTWPRAVPAARSEVRLSGPFASQPAGQEEHARSDAPWVGLAFAVPDEVDRAALALGLEVARARAARRFRSRGQEAGARAPFVAWSWLDGDPIVRLHRRGNDPVERLPGEVERGSAAQELAATRADLLAFVADLRERGPSADELAHARSRLRSELGLTPVAGAVDADRLAGLAMRQSLRRRRGIDDSRLPSLTPADAHHALLQTLTPERGHEHALLPQPRRNWHWPR